MSKSQEDKTISEAMSLLAKRRAAKRTPEQRSQQARDAAKARWKDHGNNT